MEALDLLFEHPNCALAAVVNNRTLVPYAAGWSTIQIGFLPT